MSEVGRLIQESVTDPHRRIVVRGATVLTMDPAVGDFACADILVEGPKIVAVQPGLAASMAPGTAIVVAGENTIAIPGLQDTHRHCWQTHLRRLLTSADFQEYFPTFHQQFAPIFNPEDVYVGNLLAGLSALESGATCLLDYSHNSRSREHSDAAIQGLVDSGVRAVHASAPPLSGTWDHQWPEDIGRLSRLYCRDPEGLLTLRMALFGSPTLTRPEDAITPHTLRFARELGVEVAVDAVFGPDASENIESLGRAGLLGADVTLIHCTDLTDLAWDLIADSGTKVSLCPTSDTLVGCGSGLPPVQKAIDRGIRAGISVDIECSTPSTMFAQMQAMYTIQRMTAYNRRHTDVYDAPEPMTAREVLRMATVYGAEVNGVGDRCGQLGPGRQADFVLLRTDDYCTMPLNDAVGSVVIGSDTANVDTVFVAGQVRKWRREIMGNDREQVHKLARESRDRVFEAAGRSVDVTASPD